MTDVYVTLYTTSDLADYCTQNYSDSQKAAKVVEEHLDAALSHHNHTLQPTRSSDTTYDPSGFSDTQGLLDDFRKNFVNDGSSGHPDASAHANQLLMTDAETPGVLGRADECPDPNAPQYYAGVIGGQDDTAGHSITSDRWGNPNSTTERRILGAIHEIGHQLGGNHNDGRWADRYVYGVQHTVRTPFGSNPLDPSEPENCYENSQGNEYNDNYYDSCTILCNEI